MEEPARAARWQPVMVKSKPRRRIWFILGAVVATVLGIALGVFVGLRPMIERAAMNALRRAEARFGVEVAAGEVHWTWDGQITVSDLRVTSGGEPLVRAPHVAVELDVSPWERRVRVVAVHLDHPVFTAWREADGRTNLDRVLAGFRSRGGGPERTSGGVTIDPTPPVVAMEHAEVEVRAALPKIPFGLTIPERMSFREGTVTVQSVASDAASDLRLKLEATFKDTSLDPGFGLSLGALVSKARGPERFDIAFSRPVRFMLGQRVVGFGGLAWSPAAPPSAAQPEGDRGSFEVSSLQLSVPLPAGGATGVVSAAATCERLTLAPEPLSLLRRVGEAPSIHKLVKAVDAVVVTHPIVRLEVDAAGRHSFEDLLPRDVRDEGLEVRDVPSLQPSLSRVASEAALTASDRLLAATGSGGETLAARLARKFGEVSRRSERMLPLAARALDRLFLKSLVVTGGEAILDVAGTSADLTGLDVEASVEGADGGRKRLKASFDLAQAGRVAVGGELDTSGPEPMLALEVKSERLPIDLVPADLLQALHLRPEGRIARLDLRVSAPVSGVRWDVSGEVDVEDLVFHHPSVARDPLRDLDLGWKGRVSFDGPGGSFTVADTRLRSKQVYATLDLAIGSAHGVPRLHAGLELPETPVQSVIEAIPTAMIPLLEGLRADGTLRWPASIDLDTAKPADIQIRSEPVLSGFGLVSMGKHVDFNALRGTHSYRIRLGDGTPGERLVGPYTGSWIPLESITHFLPAALTTTEDGTFYTNDGISTFAMKESLSTNIERGSFVRGASTITQQLVKNLYLGGEKTLSRKLQELFIAWQMTKALMKNEVMALYLNAIEFAPGIYGIGDAAWYYFGKRPSQLDLTEAIFLASIIPGPRRYHYFFEEGRITDRWRSYLQSLLKVMLERGKITEEEYLGAAPYEPHFRGTAGAAMAPDEDRPPPDFDTPPEDDAPDELPDPR